MLEMFLLEIQEKPSRDTGIRAFSSGVKNVKRRTYGRLSLGEDGSLVFAYRRLFFGPEKTVVIGKAGTFAVARGIFHPTVVEPIEAVGKERVVFRLLPTYRGVEEEVRACLQCAEVHELRWTKGFRSVWKFLTEDESCGGERLEGHPESPPR
jgi:hypothetical protein